MLSFRSANLSMIVAVFACALSVTALVLSWRSRRNKELVFRDGDREIRISARGLRLVDRNPRTGYRSEVRLMPMGLTLWSETLDPGQVDQPDYRATLGPRGVSWETVGPEGLKLLGINLSGVSVFDGDFGERIQVDLLKDGHTLSIKVVDSAGKVLLDLAK